MATRDKNLAKLTAEHDQLQAELAEKMPQLMILAIAGPACEEDMVLTMKCVAYTLSAVCICNVKASNSERDADIQQAAADLLAARDNNDKEA